MRLGFALACALLLTSITVSAEPAPELRLLSEHAVDGMRGGNLSGLAQCGDALCGRSPTATTIRSTASIPARPSGRRKRWASTCRRCLTAACPGGCVRGPGWRRSCVAVIWISKASPATAPAIATSSAKPMRRSCKCRRRGRLLAEDFADAWFARRGPAACCCTSMRCSKGWRSIRRATRLWLAAERESRGLLLIKRKQTVWDCDGGCVLLSEGGHGNAASAISQCQSDAAGFCRPVAVQRQAVYP